MSVLARVGQFFNLGRQTAADDPRRGGWLFPTTWIPSELRLTDAQATNVSTVYACIRLIAEALASSPWRVYSITGRKRELAPDDPLDYLLNQRPNPEITAISFREALAWSAMANGGNGYAEIQRSGSGSPTALWPLAGDRMRLIRDDVTKQLIYLYADVDGSVRELPPRDVFHLRGPVSVSALLGESVVGKAARSAALATAAQRFGLSFLANGAQPTGVLTFPGKLDQKSMERIREQVRAKTQGVGKAGSPLLLEGGMKFEPLQSDPSKAMMVDTLVWATEDLARYFGVPLTLLGVQAAAQGYGTNVSQLYLSWTRTGLRPWAMRFEQEANDKLFPVRQRGSWRETTLDMEWLTRGDAKTQAEADEIRIRSGVDSVNDVLERLGRNTIGTEGDIRFVSTALQPLTDELLDIQELQAKEPEPAPSSPPALPAHTPEGGPADPQDGEDISAYAQAVIGACLDRYGSRIRARRREMGTHHPPDKVDQAVAEVRAIFAPKVEGEIGAVMKLAGREWNATALSEALTAMDTGTGADVAAAKFWSTT